MREGNVESKMHEIYMKTWVESRLILIDKLVKPVAN